MDSESSLTGLEDVLISHQSHTSSNPEDCSLAQQHHSASQVPDPAAGQVFPSSMTPIDKLYSMQNSYFSSNECECLGAAN